MRFQVLLFAVCVSLSSFSQICTIDYSQTQTGLYPDTLPVGYVGQPYSEDITFVMPLDTMGYDFTNFYIMSVSLPVGLNWQCNSSANNCNYNPQQDQHGCVNISGTPLLAGVYSVFVTVIADLTIVQGYPFQFQIYFEVLPSNTTTSNNGFSMTGPTGCSPITVGFTNNNPGMLAYLWDFGNGNISTLENPVPQVYTTPGDYVVEYTAWNNLDTIDVYTLTGIDVTSMSNYGGGFPSYETPDAYVILKENGNTIFQSPIAGNQNTPVGWNTSILLNPSNTYVIEVWEADDSFGELQFFGDDYMGSHTLMLTGCNGCAAGTSSINYNVNHQIIYPNAAVVSVDTVHVYGYPPVPSISFDSPSLQLSTPDLGYSYQWYFNDSPIAGATNPSYTIYQSGVYHVVAVNTTGCVSFSDTLTAVYCDPDLAPVIDVNQAGDQLIATDVPLGYTLQWMLNDFPISGQTNDTIDILMSGIYSVEMVDSFGCVHASEPYGVGLGVNDISDFQWQFFPNPASQHVTVSFNEQALPETIEILDLTGRIYFRQSVDSAQMVLSLADLPPGMVFLRVYKGSQQYTRQLMVTR
jgi:hypothetical protein